MNILIPMAGKGKRFQDVGYTLPKPLIDVDGKPMIQRVVENLPIKGKYIFLVQKNQSEKYELPELLNKITGINDCEIIEIDEETPGQAVTAMFAKDLIDNEEELLIVNSDSYFLWDVDDFEKTGSKDHDGMIFTFEDKTGNRNWCYAKTDENNYVEELVEKVPVSDQALAGAFYYKKGSDFVKYTEQMIAKNKKVNNEFYIGPVFNEAIEDGKSIFNYQLFGMKSMGTPEELDSFLKWIEVMKVSRKINDFLFDYNRYEKELRNIRTNKMKNAIEDIRNGKPVIVVDDYDRENEGDLVVAGEKADVENIVFCMKYARGLMCVPILKEKAKQLNLHPMVEDVTDPNQTPFTVSVDGRDGTTTGMSVHDRLETLRIILGDETKPEELTRPGHLFPLVARDKLLKERRGHTEGSVELVKLAGLKPVAVIIEIVNDDGTMAKGADLDRFAIQNGLSIISIEEIYETAYNKSV